MGESIADNTILEYDAQGVEINEVEGIDSLVFPFSYMKVRDFLTFLVDTGGLRESDMHMYKADALNHMVYIMKNFKHLCERALLNPEFDSVELYEDEDDWGYYFGLRSEDPENKSKFHYFPRFIRPFP